jgi:ferredoxin-NADP reductase
VGGGSGVVPLMAMLRHRRRARLDVPLRLVCSFRSPETALYRDELGPETIVTYTRQWAPDWAGARGRITAELLADVADPDGGEVFICGSNGFVEGASTLLLAAGYRPQAIRTERFGPTG